MWKKITSLKKQFKIKMTLVLKKNFWILKFKIKANKLIRKSQK